MVFSLCEWGLSKPWLWAEPVGHLWRTTGDIQNNWGTPDAKEGKVWGGGVIVNLDMQKGLEKYAGPDHWNDPDMLEVGNGKLTPEESRAHFSLWCMLAAPLMAGNDLSNMSTLTKDVLLNKEAIAIDQDKLGKQGYKILDEEDFDIFMKPLAGGNMAVCLFNRGETARKIRVDWKKYGIADHYSLRDVWKHAAVGTTKTPFDATIARHDVVLLVLTAR
jgi:alpha-galactosidase